MISSHDIFIVNICTVFKKLVYVTNNYFQIKYENLLIDFCPPFLGIIGFPHYFRVSSCHNDLSRFCIVVLLVMEIKIKKYGQC